MTDIDLDAIEDRANTATPGPWKLITDSCDCGDGFGGCSHGEFPHALRLPTHTVKDIDRPCDPTDPLDHYRHDVTEFGDLTMEDGEFIARSRTDVPNMAAEIRRLRADSTEAHTQCRRLNRELDDTRAELADAIAEGRRQAARIDTAHATLAAIEGVDEDSTAGSLEAAVQHIASRWVHLAASEAEAASEIVRLRGEWDRLVKERAAMLDVIEAAKAWRAQFSKPSSAKLPRAGALMDAVDALPGEVA